MTADKSAAAWHPGDGPVKPLDLDAIRAPLPDDARMDAYYYDFDRTGVGVVDAILSAVAVAGKGAHSTESWQDDDEEELGFRYHADRAGLVDGSSAVDQIQKNAARAADAVRALLAALAAETARAHQAEQRIADAPHGSGCGHVDWDADGLLQLGRCDCWKSAAPTTEQ